MPRVESLQVELSVDEGLLYEGLFLGAFVLSSSCVGVVLCAALAGGSCLPLLCAALVSPSCLNLLFLPHAPCNFALATHTCQFLLALCF